MRSVLLAAVFAALAGVASATTINTSNWSEENSPNFFESATWVTGGTGASATGNREGTLVSDFTVSGTYNFSGTMQSIVSSFNDDDIMGAVLGWTDAQNHIRIGLEGGGFNDRATNASGFWIVQEVGGVSSVLAQSSSFRFVKNAVYNFDFDVTATSIEYDISTGGSSVLSGTVNPTASTAGGVGLYTESQAAAFANLSVTQPTAVPLPAAGWMLLAGLGGLGVMRRRRASS